MNHRKIGIHLHSSNNIFGTLYVEARMKAGTKKILWKRVVQL